MRVLHAQISSSGTGGWQIFNSNVTQNTVLDGSRIFSNPGVGLRISGTSQVILVNTAAVSNTGGGILLAQSGVQATLLQTTLAEILLWAALRKRGFSCADQYHPFQKCGWGLAETGSTVTLNSTLWDANTTASSGGGSVVNNSPYSGSAAFDPADGYHLTLYSQALGKGQNAGIFADIDARSRPQPGRQCP